jgi:glycosyltransferase involved in cell wall biosynthesis
MGARTTYQLRSTVAPVPVVSIGMPVYNAAPFLRQALESVLAQSLNAFELLISDNASTDSTEDICCEYARRDPRVHYVRQASNLGLPANWNYVARHARGRFFKWASGNDYLAPTMLEACVHELETHPEVVLAYGRTRLVDELGVRDDVYVGDFAALDDAPSARFRAVTEQLALNNAISGVHRTAVLKQTGLIRPYPGSDLVLLVELALRGTFAMLHDVFFYRRIAASSFSGRLGADELRKLHDPTARYSQPELLMRHRDLIAAILRAPISFREKSRCLAIAAKHLYWEKARLFDELIGQLPAKAPRRRRRASM